MGALKSKSWLIRNDGQEIRVLDYPQGVKDNLIANVGVAAFLCKYDKLSVVVRFLNWFFAEMLVDNCSKLMDLNDEGLELEIQNQLMQLPRSLGDWQDLSLDQVTTILYRARKKELYRTGTQAFDFSATAIDPTGDDMWRELNQAFVAARIGGRLISVPGNKDLHFLIRSRYVDWTQRLKNFVKYHQNEIDTVTVERYIESDAQEGFVRPGKQRVYLTDEGKPIYKMQVGEFLDITMEPTFPPMKQAFWKSCLASGVSVATMLYKQPHLRRQDLRQEFTTCLDDEYRATRIIDNFEV